MVEIVKVTCRHCGHKFVPRVEKPRQCGKCWGVWPTGPKEGILNHRGKEYVAPNVVKDTATGVLYRHDGDIKLKPFKKPLLKPSEKKR
jgi:hypothetical protein